MIPEENCFLQQQIILVTGSRLSVQGSVDEFRQKLAEYIHELIGNNFEKLISILYRLDVSENKLKTLLAEKATDDAGILIADAIIERQSEKIVSRKKYKGSAKDIPEEEQW